MTTKGTCRICSTEGTKLVALKAGTYHRECLRMQKKGLLYTGPPPKIKDSTGQPCTRCRDTIDSPHAHKAGKPYHRECL